MPPGPERRIGGRLPYGSSHAAMSYGAPFVATSAPKPQPAARQAPGGEGSGRGEAGGLRRPARVARRARMGGGRAQQGEGLLCGGCACLCAVCARLRPSRKATWPYALVSIVFVALVASEHIAPLLPSTTRAREQARSADREEEAAVSGPLTRIVSAMWRAPSPPTATNATTATSAHGSSGGGGSSTAGGGSRGAHAAQGEGGVATGGAASRSGGLEGEHVRRRVGGQAGGGGGGREAGVAGKEQAEGRGSGGAGREEEECSECWEEVDRLRALRAKEGGSSGQLVAKPHGSGGAAGARRRLLVQAAGTREGVQAAVAAVEAEVAEVKAKMSDLAVAVEQLAKEAANIQAVLQGEGHWASDNLTHQFLLSSSPSDPDRCAPLSLDRRALQRQPKRTPKGPPLSWKGYACEAAPSQIQRYTDVEARALCPDDWFFVQDLAFLKNCFALPPRACLARTPQHPTEPLPFPRSLFEQAALADGSVRWGQQQCASFQCLNSRALGDCRNCFNLSLESHRWQHRFRGNPTMRDVIRMKNGSLRLGLDVGGGTGSFAAHMALQGVTVMTTAMNYETVSGRHAGLPYFEAIAMRGLIPLFLPHKARLPFYDNTLDVVHNVNSVKYMPVLEFEELVYEWDRVLRPGGILWFEMFYAPVEDMVLYVAVLEQLRYRKLHWTLMPKPDRGEIEAHQLYLNCVIEKPARRHALKPIEF